MPAFDAGDVVEALDWDFSKAGVKAKGTVPEPTDATIGAFLDGLKKLYTDAQAAGMAPTIDENATPDQMLDALVGLTGEAFVKFMADTAELFGTLCGQKPSAAQLLQLPLRVRVRFYTWIQGEVVNPEAGTGGGTAVVRALPSAVAG